jgi:hypothetical protein
VSVLGGSIVLKPCVVILEGNPARIELMKPVLAEVLPQFEHVFFKTAPEMIAWLDEGLARAVFISLDHDLDSVVPVYLQPFDPDCGQDVVEYLACKPSVCPVIVHTANTGAGWSMLHALRNADWIVSRVYPSDGMNWILTDWASDIRAYVRRGLIL